MSDKLKPCPFCGSEARMTLRSVLGPFNIEAIAECTNHHCPAKRSLSIYLYHDAGRAIKGSAVHLRHLTEELLCVGEAITELWNRRTPCGKTPDSE